MKIQTVDFGSTQAPQQFTQSLRETGFAVVRNHIVTEGLLKDVYAEWQEFFASNEKHQYQFNPQTHAGYFPFKSENAKGYVAKDLKEFYHLYRHEDLPRNIRSNATLVVRNQLIFTAKELLGWLDMTTPWSVRTDRETSLKSMIENSQQTLLRVLHYPSLEGEQEPGAVRAAAHEDINLITVLPAATQPGLEVLDLQGNWHKVECNPGDLIVNAGDMLQVATNGHYKSTTHRVVNPDGSEALKSRYSLPLFLHPRPDVKLSSDLTAGQYLTQRLQELGLK